MSNNKQLHRILKKLKEIEDKLNRPKSLDDYISEFEAKNYWEGVQLGSGKEENRVNCPTQN